MIMQPNSARLIIIESVLNLNEEDNTFFTTFSSSIALELLHTEITSIGVYISVH